MTTPTDAQIDARIAKALERFAVLLKKSNWMQWHDPHGAAQVVAAELRKPEPAVRSDVFSCPSCSLRCRVRHCTTHVDCHGTGVHTKSDTACIHVAVEARKDEPEPAPAPEPTYPCAKCGALRTKAEGGTTFTVCDKCWDESHPVGGANTPPQPAPPTPAWCNHCRAPWTAATCAGLAHLGRVTGAMPQPTQPQPTPSQPSLTLEQQAAIIAAQSGITECLLGTSQPSLVERLRKPEPAPTWCNSCMKPWCHSTCAGHREFAVTPSEPSLVERLRERATSTITFMADADLMREAADALASAREAKS